MRDADNASDLWRYGILLSKIVDGRFLIAHELPKSPSPLLDRYGSTFNDGIGSRIDKWKKKREDKLFGVQAQLSVLSLRVDKRCRNVRALVLFASAVPAWPPTTKSKVTTEIANRHTPNEGTDDRQSYRRTRQRGLPAGVFAIQIP